MGSVTRAGERERGQGIVEFAIVLPVFVFALFGLFDVGRLVYVNSALSQAAREGARVAAAQASWIGRSGGACVSTESAITSANPGAHVCPANVAAFKANVMAGVNRMVVSVGPLSAVHISCNAGTADDPVPSGDWTEGSGGNGCQDGSGTSVAADGELVSVRALHTYQPMTPLISSLIGSVDLSGSATMVIN
jgi:Flp pilus assembly protein TadG